MLETFETVAKAIADPNRTRILKLLEGGELCVCQITAVLDLTAAAISKHLSTLKTAGLLLTRRDGKWVYYRLSERHLNLYARQFLDLMEVNFADDPTINEDRRILALVNAVPVQVLCNQGRAALGPNVQAVDTTPCCGSTP